MSGKVFHGGGLDAAIAEFGGARDNWLDLSTGINPNGWQVREVSPASWARLPDRAAMSLLLDAARDYYGAGRSSVVAVPGTQVVLEVLPHVIGSKSVAIVSPTYGEHAHVWRKAGASVQMVGEPDATGSETLLVVNPNNPDGRIWPGEMLLAQAEALARRGGWLIVDEAFADVLPETSLLQSGELPENVLVLKSLGKFFGLAGLRLGFAIGAEGACRAIGERLGPWAVSGPALEIGAAALSDHKWIGTMRGSLTEAGGRLAEILEVAGLEVMGENPLFVFARHGEAQAIHRGLARRHILVRPFPEMPDCLRFGLPGTDAEFERLASAIAEAIGEA